MAQLSMTFSRKGGMGPIGARTKKLLMAAVKKATLEVEREAKRAIMTGPKTGKVYGAETEVSFTTKAGKSVSFTANRGKKKVHQASAPGEAPATDTGTLVNSIRSSVKPMEGTIRVTAEYAAILEFGGAHVAARPFMKPAMVKVRPKFVQACKQAIQKGAKA